MSQPNSTEPDAFQAFQSIPRLFRDCVVTEKIDGTNGVIFIPDADGPILAGSRSRWIYADGGNEKDNHGFAKWVKANEEDLRSLGPGYHYGEWWGAGIQRRYGLTEKRFSLFNAGRWGEGGKDADKKPKCCHVVPVLYRGTFSMAMITGASNRLKVGGSVAAPGFMDPEGIVVYHEAGRSLFKYTFDGDGHKSAKPPREKTPDTVKIKLDP